MEISQQLVIEERNVGRRQRRNRGMCKRRGHTIKQQQGKRSSTAILAKAERKEKADPESDYDLRLWIGEEQGREVTADAKSKRKQKRNCKGKQP